MKTTIRINEVKTIESKKPDAKFKEFKTFETDRGNFSCFKNEVVEELKKNVGNIVEVEYSERGDYKNITEFVRVVEEKPKVEQENMAKDKFKEARESKDVSMYTSYAKDIFIAVANINDAEDRPPEAIMEEAISLVRQAKEAFKNE